MPLTWTISTCKKKKTRWRNCSRSCFECSSYSTRTLLVQYQYYEIGSEVWCQGVECILFGRVETVVLYTR